MVSHSGRGECGAAEWQQSNSVGDPADQSVYSADTFSRRCEGLGFSSDRIYCPPCPRLLSTVFQSACSVINVLKLHTHTLTRDWLWKWKGGNKPLSDVSRLRRWKKCQRRQKGGFEWVRTRRTRKLTEWLRWNHQVTPGSEKPPSSSWFTSIRGRSPQPTPDHICNKHGGLVLITAALPPAL